MNNYIPLNRSIIKITGKDSREFLQSIITNNIDNCPIYSLLLTPQGKVLFDFFVFYDKAYYLDISKDKAEEFIKRINMYKLRSEVSVLLMDEYEVVSLFGKKLLDNDKNKFCKGYIYKDPRSQNMGARSYILKDNNYKSFIVNGFSLGDEVFYNQQRIKNLLPEADELIIEPYPLNLQMDYAIDFSKGCYIGQEVTARMKYRGKVKKKLEYIKGNIEQVSNGIKTKVISSINDDNLVLTNLLTESSTK